MSKKILFIIVFTLFVLVGCSGNREQQMEEKTADNNEELVGQFREDDTIISQSSGMISYGFEDGSPDQYTYREEAVEIPYYIENMGTEGEENADVGLLLFVNGEVQPFSVDGKEATMHKINISPGERKELKLSFFPVSGKKGEKIGIIPAVIWNPDYVPESEERPVFGNCLKLGTNIPLTIQMEADGKNAHKGAQTNAKIMDIPEEILAQNEISFGEGDYDSLDSSVGFTIEPTKEKTNLLKAENGRADIIMNLYGGKQVTDKITVFVNNEPIKIDGGDYVEVKTKKGKMWQIKFSLDVSGYARMNTIYAVVMTSGEDYRVSDIYQSNILLLATETASSSSKNPDGIQKSGKKTEQGSEKIVGGYFYFDYNLENNDLELTNLKTGKIVRSIAVGKKKDIMAVFQWENGYAVAMQTLRKERKRRHINGIYIPDDSEKTEKDVKDYKLLLYDKELKQVKKIDLMGAIHDSGWGELLEEKPVMNWEGTEIAWLSYENKLLHMNLTTGERKKSNAFSKKGIEVKQMGFVGTCQLAFIADEGETDARYGYLDLEKEKLSSFVERNYQVSEMRIDGRYICVNDVEEPYTNSSSGKILVLNCETDKQNTFEVDGIESTRAAVTADGRSVIAMKWLNDHAFRVRKYDYETGKTLYEKKIKKKEIIKPDQIMRSDRGYVVTYVSDLGRGYACEIGIN